MFVNTLSDYLKSEFGCKLYKLSLSADVTCPNRDGTCGTGGCIFCSEGGSGEFGADKNLSVTEQIEAAKALVSGKIKSGKYIAYFQSYTNTYAPLPYLEEIFTEAVNHKDISVLSVATRPDCLPDGVLSLLERLSKIKPVWVELGLQTMHESTAKLIRRGYSLPCFEEAVKRLKAIGVKVIVHIIIGLPGETEEMIYKTADYIGKCGADGVKLQLLHVLKNTDLEKMYKIGEMQVLSRDEYFHLLCGCIERIPKNVVIHRMTGDGAKNLLIAPLWSADKRSVLNALNKKLREENIVQGSKTKNC